MHVASFTPHRPNSLNLSLSVGIIKGLNHEKCLLNQLKHSQAT